MPREIDDAAPMALPEEMFLKGDDIGLDAAVWRWISSEQDDPHFRNGTILRRGTARLEYWPRRALSR